MKLNPIYALPFVFSLFSTAVFAEAPEFTEADKDSDGVLSIEEANAALPELNISDDNGDGIVNHTEAEKSVAGLDLPMPAEFNDQTIAPIGVTEYVMIVQAMDASRNDA